MTILSFAAMFAGMDAVTGETGVVAFVTGVFVGSALWWLALSSLIGLLRGRVSTRVMMWINRISGVVIVAFGLIALFGARFGA
jgi:arginine exporter protein ArgO